MKESAQGEAFIGTAVHEVSHILRPPHLLLPINQLRWDATFVSSKKRKKMDKFGTFLLVKNIESKVFFVCIKEKQLENIDFSIFKKIPFFPPKDRFFFYIQ